MTYCCLGQWAESTRYLQQDNGLNVISPQTLSPMVKCILMICFMVLANIMKEEWNEFINHDEVVVPEVNHVIRV
jgi:hypothetical protein